MRKVVSSQTMPSIDNRITNDRGIWLPALSLAVFTVCYWVAAYYKPFHVDEFFSLVYAERCTFKEIIKLKEFGIGHPPLFHLLQKLMMEVFPGYHFLLVRVVNYGAGILFVLLSTRMLLRHGSPGLFPVAIACSAAVLNVFVFSRMWGLVCLSSLLLLMTGERYVRTGRARYLLVLFGVCVLGFFSDYNFILMMPYVFLVVTSRRGSLIPMKVMYGTLCFVVLLAMIFRAFMDKGDFGWLVYNWLVYFPLSIPRLAFEAAKTVLHFWFFEPFMVALLVIVCAVCVSEYKTNGGLSFRNWSGAHLLILFVVLFVCIDGLIRVTPIRARYAVVLVLLVSAFVCLYVKRQGFLEYFKVPERMMHSILAGMMILVAVSPLFYRDLRDARFLAIMWPHFAVWGCLQLNRRVLNLLSAMLIVSGMFYVTSKGIEDFFPAPEMPAGAGYIYEDVFAYANQYLRAPERSEEEALFLNMGAFERFCRICRMGRKVEDFDHMNSVVVLARRGFDAGGFMRAHGMRFAEKRDVGLTTIDRLQAKYFTPLGKARYALFEFHRASGE